MCSNERSTSGSVSGGSLLPYPLTTLKQLTDASAPTPSTPLLQPLDQYRLQLYNYAMAERLRFTQQLYPAPLPLCPSYPPYSPRLAFSMSLFHHRALQPEEPKPQHSYIGLIAMAILSHPDMKLVLSDIYQHILDHYPYFRARGPGWRNSIRHNLSLNDCFVKAGRSANGKGHYWAIHAANVDDFRKGDFRRRKAQRKVRKHMGLSVDEEAGDSPSPPPVPVSPLPVPGFCWGSPAASTPVFPALSFAGIATKKRQFDVASLLAPDEDVTPRKIQASRRCQPPSSGEEDNAEEDIDVVTSEEHQAPIWCPQLVTRYYEQLAAQQQQQQRRFMQQMQQQQLEQSNSAAASNSGDEKTDS